jgi:hypothetical protein
MPVVSPLIRKVTAALAVATPCLLFVATADASPVRKAHSRPPAHKVTHRRVATPVQAFVRLANRHPERRLSRHPQTWLKSAPHAPESSNNDAAIQNNGSPASAEIYQDTPALQPLDLLVPVQAQLQSHDGFAHRSPRAPPVAG